MLKNQKGFTLIEIIAVLVILGILAAVAVPKYMDLQGDARGRAMIGAVAALQSTASMDYAKGLLNNTYNSLSGPTDATVNVGDYSGTYATTTAGQTTVTVTGGPDNWGDYPVAVYNKVKIFNIR